MPDPIAAPPVDATAPAVTPPAADPAPAPSGDSSAPAKTLLTSGEAPADPSKPADPPAADPAKPAVTAPEKYDFAALKLPEGVALNADVVAAVEPVFKELGLTQEGANKLITAHAEALAKAEGAAEKAREADFASYMADTAKKHVEAVQKEWGADYDANLKVAQRGLARFCDPEMKALLDETGLGNHPKFLKAFLGIGKMIQEDTPPAGPTGTRKSDAEVFYGQAGNA